MSNFQFSIFNFQFDKGQSLVELLLAIALAGVMMPALITGLVNSREGKAQQSQRLQAVALVKEAEEAARVVREKDWITFAVNGTYHPEVISNTWSLLAGPETINGFSRSVVISDGADLSIKKVVVTVSWSTPRTSSVASTMYLSRYLQNNTFVQTAEAEFNAGTKTNVAVTNVSGGEVVLAAGGGGSWCDPNLSITALDLPGQGITTAISAVEGRAYTTTGGNASGDSMDSVSISNTNPPQATNLDPYNLYKTYGIFADNNYAYLTSDHPGTTVDIVQVSSVPFTQVGSFNAREIGKSVFVLENIGFVTVENKLYTFDLTSKNGARPQLGSVTLAEDGNKVTVIGNYAYVAIDSESTQLQIIQVSPDGKTLTVVGQATVAGGEAKDVFVNSSATTAYLVTESKADKREMFIVDVTTKTGNRPAIGSYDTNGMDPRGIVVVPGNKAIVVGYLGEQYQVIDITTPTTPARCGGLTNPNGAVSINAISSILETDGDIFSYILTDIEAKEFQIIEGGPGGKFAPLGTFESSTFDAGTSVAFNRFDVTAVHSSQTNITYQVAGALPNPVSGDCTGATFSFVGPDLTGNTYFATSSAIPLSQTGAYLNPARCFRYRAYLSTTDITQGPTFFDITVNYSP